MMKDKEALSNVLRQASFDKLRTNGKWMIPLVVSFSNHKRNRLVQHLPEQMFKSLILCR